MNSFNETGPGEPEQDANSALIELDKGNLNFIFDNTVLNLKNVLSYTLVFAHTRDKSRLIFTKSKSHFVSSFVQVPKLASFCFSPLISEDNLKKNYDFLNDNTKTK